MHIVALEVNSLLENKVPSLVHTNFPVWLYVGTSLYITINFGFIGASQSTQRIDIWMKFLIINHFFRSCLSIVLIIDFFSKYDLGFDDLKIATTELAFTYKKEAKWRYIFFILSGTFLLTT